MGLFQKIFGTKESRRENRENRRENRLNRILARQDGRTDRAYIKGQSNIAAYQMGIDPKASMWQGISNLGASAANAASNIFGSKGVNNVSNAKDSVGGMNSLEGENAIKLFFLVLLGYIIYKNA